MSSSSLAAGWLVDITGSYTATFFLSGTALLASSLVLFTAAVIRRCHRQLTSKSTKHEPLSLSDQSDCFIAFNKEVVSQAGAS